MVYVVQYLPNINIIYVRMFLWYIKTCTANKNNDHEETCNGPYNTFFAFKTDRTRDGIKKNDEMEERKEKKKGDHELEVDGILTSFISSTRIGHYSPRENRILFQRQINQNNVGNNLRSAGDEPCNA